VHKSLEVQNYFAKGQLPTPPRAQVLFRAGNPPVYRTGGRQGGVRGRDVGVDPSLLPSGGCYFYTGGGGGLDTGGGGYTAGRGFGDLDTGGGGLDTSGGYERPPSAVRRSAKSARALSLRALKRGSEFELFSVELAPMLLALEATVFARLLLLLPRTRAALDPSANHPSSLYTPTTSSSAAAALAAAAGGRRAARLLFRALSPVLESPPDWSRRAPLYFDLLRISQIDVTVSSALEVRNSD